MANTINILQYTNTFGDWIVNTNAMANEINYIGSQAWTKDSGLLTLNGIPLGLLVKNDTTVGGKLSVTGIGSSANISNNLWVGGQLTLANSGLSISTYGTANIGSTLTANGTANGLIVANNTLMYGNTTIYGIGNILGSGNALTVANNVVIGANTTTNNLTVTSRSNNNILNANTLTIATNTTTSNLIVTSTANVTSANVGTLVVTGALTITGNYIQSGPTTYTSPTFTLNSGAAAQNASYTVNRSAAGANSEIRWNESSLYWDILDVNASGTYSRIMTANMISSSIISTSTTTIASSAAANTLNNYINSANTWAQGNVGSALSQAFANTGAGLNAANTWTQANVGSALSQAKSYTDSKSGFTNSMTFSSDVTVAGNLIVNGASASFNVQNIIAVDNNITLGNVATPTNVTADGGGVTLIGATNKTLNYDNANTAWTSSENVNLYTGKVYKIAGTTVLSGSTLGSGITASSLTSVGTISSGTWSGSFGTVSGAALTSLTAGNLLGTIPSAVLTNSTHYIGTTAITLSRATGAQTLTGVNIDGTAGNTSASLTITTGGAGTAPGSTFNGGAAVTISYNSIGASPLAGSSSLVTTGIISTGTWNAGVIGIAYGGTNSTATATANGIGYGTGIAHAYTANSTSAGQVLTTVAAGGIPSWQSQLTTTSIANTSNLPITVSAGCMHYQSSVTAQAVAITINNPTGTAVDGQKLIIRLKDNGVVQTVTWQSSYRAMGSYLPASTVVASKTTYVACVYNGADSVWDVVSATTQF